MYFTTLLKLQGCGYCCQFCKPKAANCETLVTFQLFKHTDSASVRYCRHFRSTDATKCETVVTFYEKVHHSRGEPLRPPAPIQKCRKKHKSVSLGFQKSRKKRRFVSSGLQKSRKKRRSLSSAATRAALEFSANSGPRRKLLP